MSGLMLAAFESSTNILQQSIRLCKIWSELEVLTQTQRVPWTNETSWRLRSLKIRGREVKQPESNKISVSASIYIKVGGGGGIMFDSFALFFLTYNYQEQKKRKRKHFLIHRSPIYETALLCYISGFHRGITDPFALLRCCAPYSYVGSCSPTFRDS